jgi:hypothetical protein
MDITMCSFTFDYLAIGCQQLAGHHTQASEALGEDVTLNITIVVLGRPYEASRRLDSLSDHVINESMLIVYSQFIKGRLILPAIY